MTRIVRKKFINRLTQSFWSYFFLIIFASLFTYSAIGAYHKSRLASDKMEAAQIDHAGLEEQKAKLISEIENANTEFGQEKAMRERFNVTKEGEQVIVLLDDKNPKKDEELKEEKTGFRLFWSNLFKK